MFAILFTICLSGVCHVHESPARLFKDETSCFAFAQHRADSILNTLRAVPAVDEEVRVQWVCRRRIDA